MNEEGQNTKVTLRHVVKFLRQLTGREEQGDIILCE
jgi:hypothetical protein